MAKANGVLERNGHTEATVDLMRLAGLEECGLCCEIMREDGTMMRTPELIELARQFNLKFISIKALQDYRKKHECHVVEVADTAMPTRYGAFRAHAFVNKLNGEHHVALVKGDIGDGVDVLVRVHSSASPAMPSAACAAIAASSWLQRWPRWKPRGAGWCCTCARKGAASGL